MKNRKIWFVIAVIIAVGILVTMCNAFFLEKQSVKETAAAKEQLMNHEVSSPEEPEGLDRDREASDGIQDTDGALIGPGAGSGTTADSAGAGEETEVLSPLETPVAAVPETVPPSPDGKSYTAERDSYLLVEVEEGPDYRARLDELDLQIQKMWSEETESTTYSMKTAAENELKLWDSELNNIYNDILNRLNEEEKEALVLEEREWMKNRDAKAVEAAKKSAGGTLEGLEYTMSLAASTRQRAYELASIYEQVSE